MKRLKSDRERGIQRFRGQEMGANTDTGGYGRGLRCGHEGKCVKEVQWLVDMAQAPSILQTEKA